VTLSSKNECPKACGNCQRSRCGDVARTDLVIGLVNNMPDAALEATERQFRLLLGAAASGISLRLMLCRMPSVPRNAAAESYLRGNYVDIDSVFDTEIDGLIVTGREPLQADLRDEPFWDSTVRLLEWARERTVSTIWSCLAAQAAVLHLDGIQRVRSQRKHCGVFDCSRISDHPFVANLPLRYRMPHSRWNGLPHRDLAGSGYELLALAGDAGVDCFLRHETGESLFLFFQGHPEYQPNTLLLEYRRDLLRYLRGETTAWPDTPRGMLTPKDEAALQDIRSEAHALREEETLARLSQLLSGAGIENGWHGTATTLYRNWLEYLVAHKALRANEREAAAMAWCEQGRLGEIPFS
jgi:homoserine O-succinyltransferase